MIVTSMLTSKPNGKCYEMRTNKNAGLHRSFSFVTVAFAIKKWDRNKEEIRMEAEKR